MILVSGIGALTKVQDAYMDDVDLSTDPTRSILGNLLWVVVMLFWKYYDQFKSGFAWMTIYINH